MIEIEGADSPPCLYTIGGPTIFQHLTDSPQNQHVFLLFLKIDKSKISKKSNEN